MTVKCVGRRRGRWSYISESRCAPQMSPSPGAKCAQGAIYNEFINIVALEKPTQA
jgi:hypothetical protein